MSPILTDEAVVLRKTDYGETSKIVALYTERGGKISGIVKGGRGDGGKRGRVLDPLNLVQVTYYDKESREVQTVSSADLLEGRRRLREDALGTMYGFAALELTLGSTSERDPNPRLFRGLKRILQLFDERREPPSTTMARYFAFLLGEVGFDLPTERCAVCDKPLGAGAEVGYRSTRGFACGECARREGSFAPLPTELFAELVSLKTGGGANEERTFSGRRALSFLERFMSAHAENYRGLRALEMANDLEQEN
jgi:DNA repair protein RecO (recombination protein O)